MNAANTARASSRARLQQAVALHRRGELAAARAGYEAVLGLEPLQPDAWHLLGVIAAQTDDPARAVALIGRAVELDPTNAIAHGNLGSALRARGDLGAALAAYTQAVALQVDYADAHLNRGLVLQDLGEPEAALASYERAIAANPGLAAAYLFRGNLLYQLRQPEAALASYDAAIRIGPDFAEAYSNRGNVLRELDRFDAALASYTQAVALNPRFAQAYFNRGVALAQLKRPQDALADYDQALALEPELAEAHFNRALLLLLTGDYVEGWREHEWRWRNRFGSNIHERRNFTEPLWLGTPALADRTILLHGEQGFGDTLQLCRYVTRVAELGARVVLEVPLPLASLLGCLDGVTQLVVRGDPLPPFDYHCPLMSLPLAFKTEVSSIPAPTRYLQSDARKVAAWENRLGRKSAPRVGLMWNGNPIQPNDRNRSFWLADWLPHLPPGYQYVSLQRTPREPDRRTLAENPHILDPSDGLNDFSETAALCECLDVVLSVCTSVAHLSAALGKPTWILLTHAADWRWLLDRRDSPWYPTAVLFRQRQRGDWRFVFAEVARELMRCFPCP
jgi:tetratricopeptide (TPR) repeat protein